MIKSDSSESTTFDRPKLLLFKFLAHQIHPFAYAVNTFLRPALDDCLGLMRTNPQDTFNVLLSLTQTFTRFAPESELIYDDIQQFAIKLKDAIDQCFTCLDRNTIQESSQLLQSADESLLAIIEQQNMENTTYTNMYKNMSAVLTNLEKINSLPMEMQSIDKIMHVHKINKQQTMMKVNGRSGVYSVRIAQEEHALAHNDYVKRNITTTSGRSTTITPPPGMLPIQTNKPTVVVPPPITNPTQPSRLPQNTISPSTVSVMSQMKGLSVSSTPVPTTTLSSSSRPMSSVTHPNEHEIVDTSTQPAKKPTPTVASFPPRQNASLFTSVTSTNDKPSSTSTTTNGHYSSALLNEAIKKDHAWLQSKSNNHEVIYNQQRATPTPSNGTNVRFGNTSELKTASVPPSIHENSKDNWGDNISRPYSLNTRSSGSINTNTEWYSAKANRPAMDEPSYFDQTKSLTHPHITDEYIQEFGNKHNRPVLRGELSMTFGTPENGPQASCLPIGVGLSYDELTLLSCDVHRNAHNVRLFDIQTGRLKHTISSSQQMKLHRPGAVTSNARNNILIVQRDSIYITEPDGRLIQTIGHRSIQQLYGIALFRDRYILTIDSKAVDNQSAETCRLLLFDPNCDQLVFEQDIAINRQSENVLTQQYSNHIQGRVLSETSSKPRFLAVHNDDICIADLGRSLIYGTSLRNQFDLTCTTVFGGQGRANGEMIDPSGLFIDSGGNIISADSKNDRIQLFSSDGQYKTTFKLNERIKRPSGICANRAGTQFYVSCYLAGCVRGFNIGY